MNEQIFILTTEDGGEQRCRVIFNFETDDHSYVLFTLIDDEGYAISDMTALRYELDDNGEMADFSDLETDEEWAMVEEVMNTLVAQFGADQSNFITITDDSGEEVIAEILHRFTIEGSDKNYLFYAITGDEDEAPEEIFASAYIADKNGHVEELLPIETDEEWEQVEAVLASLNPQN